MADKKNVFGLSSLANPAYSSPQATSIEQSFITGSEQDAVDGGAQEISAADMLQKRMDEVEKNIGCPIFSATAPAQASSSLQPSEIAFDSQGMSGATSAFGGAAEATVAQNDYYHPITMSNEGIQHTEEAQKRDRMASALSALSIGTDGFLDADHERDRKLIMIEEIEDLVNLFRDDGEDISHIKVPTVEDPIETIECTLKILKRHNDRLRFGNLADDCIMLMARSLETLCDGQREWLGFRPDLRGWSHHVRSKLRRMHHDTSQIASSLMNDYNIGPGSRLFLELVPNLIMYARDRSNGPVEGSERAADNPEFDAAVDRLRKK
jgi:hypothetical protein